MFHWEPAEEERRERRPPSTPWRVRVPSMVWVVPAVKVNVSATEVVLVKLWKGTEQLILLAVPPQTRVEVSGLTVVSPVRQYQVLRIQVPEHILTVRLSPAKVPFMPTEAKNTSSVIVTFLSFRSKVPLRRTIPR